MQHAVAPSLVSWESFYVIVGTSGAALTGLQFVVITLVAEARKRTTTREIDAFATPTVVHFCAVLGVSAVLSAPWQELSSTALVLGACGAAGIGYSGLVTRRALGQTGYKPVLEDWLGHIVLPFIAYAALFSAALALVRYEAAALFTIAAAVVLLLFIGIHNAWDTVIYFVGEHPGMPPVNEDAQAAAPNFETP